MSNPPKSRASNSRRISIGFVLKPDYTAPASSFLDTAENTFENSGARQDAAMGLLDRASAMTIMQKTDADRHTENAAQGKSRSSPNCAAYTGKRGEPIVGLVGRVGWQNHQMLFSGMDRTQAVAQFKTWKMTMRDRIGLRRTRQ